MTKLHDDTSGPWYRLDIDAEQIVSLEQELNGAMEQCQKPRAGWGKLRETAQVRFWIAVALIVGACVLGWLFDAPLGLLVGVGFLAMGYALFQTLNDWATAIYMLALYQSDQALFLHGHQLYIRPLGESRRMGWK